jgi:succinate dehydrogenase/fumarate reductase-like Fe-S protein
MKRVLSLLNLAYRFNVHLVKKPLTGSKGLARFLDQYGPEHLLPLSPEARQLLPGLESCINCGLCDTVCERFDAATRHLHNGPSELAVSLTRSLPDYDLIEAHLQAWEGCGACRECEGICPMGVPLRELLGFAREMLLAIQQAQEEP